ncbi:hypothetical protein [Ciceribacter sp. L1K22]|uniref:hypothetical protein n=1 Tax=Ciceribacter sp. L1K22 TaxID=2820275 RepID=UPI001ABEBA1E|nr:hypothetical protein [Ciceribacter sp. L1K22]MBO3760471.1 hypothetical protein [Ciceribacter sp. L1K22]
MEITESETVSSVTDRMSGDEVYLEMGLDPLDAVESTAFLIPARGGGPCVVAFRISVRFANNENLLKIVPMDDLIALINSFAKVIEIETIEKSANSIATLTAGRELLLERLEETRIHIEALAKYISNVTLNGQVAGVGEAAAFQSSDDS